MPIFGQKIQESVGLDIGTYSVKVSSIRKEGGKNILTAYNVKRIPAETGKTEKFIQLIRGMLDEVDISAKEVNFSLSGQDVIVRFIDFPRMNKEQLDNAMAYEAEKYIPFNVNEVVMDTVILGKGLEAGRIEVLLAAVKKDFLESRIRLAEKLGMTINVIDIDSFAMFNAFMGSNPTVPKDKGVVFLDFGHKQTSILISMGDTPYFMRQIQIGGQDITNAIAEDMGILPAEAEELKIKHDDNLKEKITRSVTFVLDELIKEMQLSFGYFENRYNKPATNFYCSGGLTYQKGVIEYMQSKLGDEVKKWNPTEGMEIAEDLSREDISIVGSQLVTSIGLALRG